MSELTTASKEGTYGTVPYRSMKVVILIDQPLSEMCVGFVGLVFVCARVF